MRQARVVLGGLVAAFLIAALPAAAGVTLTFEVSGTGAKGRESGTIYLEADRLRMESGDATVIFRGDQQKIWMIQNDGYVELSGEEMKKAGAQMRDAMAEIESQLEGLPEEQRALIEQMSARFKQAGSEGKKEPRRIVKTGKTESILDYPCVSYEVRRGEQREQEVWVADWKKFDLKAADFKALEKLGDLLKETVGPLAGEMRLGLEHKYGDAPGGEAIPGVPLRTTSFGERGTTVVELKKIAREKIEPSKFELPAGLKKKTFME